MNIATRLTLSLDHVNTGQSCVVESLIANQNKELEHRLLSLGIYPGAKLEVIRRAPLGDPIQIRLNANLLSIRKVDAAAIQVETVNEAS